jgi:hypothetical protein
MDGGGGAKWKMSKEFVFEARASEFAQWPEM